ncbi:MAG: hypothetical protein E3J35_00665 [Methanomassiliicoccales archaeon]|nr:MAG: hypothetical protein E3J35_00665 [Methanomassiliicoccales archaeon]
MVRGRKVDYESARRKEREIDPYEVLEKTALYLDGLVELFASECEVEHGGYEDYIIHTDNLGNSEEMADDLMKILHEESVL